MSCPYIDEELEKWDGVYNPMGKPCYECQDYDCEHNPNPDPWYPDDVPTVEDLAEV